MKSYNKNHQPDLRGRVSGILGLAAFIWAVLTGQDLFDAAFRGLIVYLGVSILILGASRVMAFLRVEVQEKETELLDTEATQTESRSETNRDRGTEVRSEPEPATGANG